MVDRAYTDADLDAAVAAIADPQRLRLAQDIVLRTAPALQRLLATALEEGGWFGRGHEQAMREASGLEDPAERMRFMSALLAEETRVSMLVGVAVGFELARELSEAVAPWPAGADPPAGPPRADPPNPTQED